MIYALIALIILILFIFFYYENNKLDITRYELKSENAKQNFKIIHLSDFHSKPFKAVLDKVK